MLSVEVVADMVQEWLDMGIVRVIVCGEPLLHPDFARICAIVRSAGIRVDLLTNGLLLERCATEVVASCDSLAVSLDGPPAVHDDVRGRPRAYERLARGVASVRRLAPDLPVDARCAVHALNAGELRATVATARALGLRSISFSATDFHNEAAFRREGRLATGSMEELSVTGEGLARLEAEFAALVAENRSDFESGFLSDSPSRLRRILVDHYRGLAGLGPVPVARCSAPWTSAVIEYDGTVRPCFPLEVLGRVTTTSGLDGVVNSDAALRFRGNLDVATNPACQTCVCQSDITEEIAHAWSSDLSRSPIAHLSAAEAMRGTTELAMDAP